MALHFGKRELETPKPLNAGMAAAPRYGAAPAPSATTAATASAPQPSPTGTTTTSRAGASAESGSKLTVGPNIKLKGVEITDCDTLFVEGLVEATMDSRVIQIAERGAFKGTAEIDIAEIRGSFEGNLTVREKLVICASGKVTGKIRYGKVVIEEGGQLSGDIECTVAASATQPATQPASQAAMALAA